MKTDLLPRQLLLALALIGLMIGCGGNKDTEEKPGETGKGTEEKSGEGGDAKGSSNQSAAKKPEVKKVDLATSLSGKRIVLKMPSLKELVAQGVQSPEPKEEPGEPKDAGGDSAAPPTATGVPQEMLFQFEKDGSLNTGVVLNGEAMKMPVPKAEKYTYKVDDLEVTILKNGKEDGGVTFQSPNPKKGDKLSFYGGGFPKTVTVTISKIEEAGPLKKLDFGIPGEPDGLDPEGIDGGPAFGIGPNGEFAKSKHPAFIAHTWKTDPFSRGTKHSATFGKEGVLTITPEKGKPLKGTWEVAGPQITLTYPDPETGKEQALKYRFLFGGGESESADGKTIEIESLILKGAGNNKSSIVYERAIGP
jgi:hypothetical protein